ncbi:hypothetical protein [Paenibacillus donghaensis]|nr:hypothetical protein [Paenibacillus donghaensis]
MDFEVSSDQYVKVKLTPYGEQLMREQRGGAPWVCDYSKDEDGYTTFRLWELMARFGPFIYNPKDKIFDGGIVLYDRGPIMPHGERENGITHVHTFPTQGLSHGRCFDNARHEEAGSGSFKKAVHSREELNRVTEALDNLGKFYTVHKRDEGRPPGRYTTATPDGSRAVVWYVTEVEPQSGASSTIGGIKAKAYMNTLGVEAALEEVRQLLTRRLSDFVTIEVGEGSDEQA